jgi:L-lysine exporter family protein LysE/ArgO
MFSQQVFLQGLGMGASLIMPIGAQNAHVIRTGVRGRHVVLTVATCILVDISLIALGMSGFGALVEASPRLLAACRWGGALFLLWYGGRCLLSAWRAPAQGATVPDTDNQAGKPAGGAGNQPAASARQAFTLVLALSLLNPHVYLDTVVLLGAVGSSLADGHRTAFACGAMLASLLWFSCLALLARRFAFVLARPGVWRAVEALTGATMLVLAALLLRSR